MLCQVCASFMPLENNFCTTCGAKLDKIQREVAAPAPPAPTTCAAPGCTAPVNRPGHTLCYTHWKSANTPAKPAPSFDSLLTASTLGEKLNLSSRKVNALLAEIGWIAKDGNGWITTARAAELGAVQKRYANSGVSYVLWPESIVNNKILRNAVRGDAGEPTDTAAREPSAESGFRDRFPAQHRTTDGHWVRSKAELLIDNWLYMSGVVHAYERQLPIEEEAYCDFYLPDGKVYIEYWGLESDQRYAARKKAKLELYSRYRLNLVELTDEHVRNLDDSLPKLLLRHGVSFT